MRLRQFLPKAHRAHPGNPRPGATRRCQPVQMGDKRARAIKGYVLSSWRTRCSWCNSSFALTRRCNPTTTAAQERKPSCRKPRRRHSMLNLNRLQLLCFLTYDIICLYNAYEGTQHTAARSNAVLDEHVCPLRLAAAARRRTFEDQDRGGARYSNRAYSSRAHLQYSSTTGSSEQVNN